MSQSWVFFLECSKYSFLLLYYSAGKKATAMVFIYEVIEDILPFVLNTKRPLSDIWLLRYKEDSFGCFHKKFLI